MLYYTNKKEIVSNNNNNNNNNSLMKIKAGFYTKKLTITMRRLLQGKNRNLKNKKIEK